MNQNPLGLGQQGIGANSNARIKRPTMPMLLGAAVLAVGGLGGGARVWGAPLMADPRFAIELFMDLSPLGPEREVLQVTITPGEQGFPAGMYLTTPFSAGSDSVLRISPGGDIETVLDGLNAPETILFARGVYGLGMFIAEAGELRIQRLMADGTTSTFASNAGTATFGAKQMAYGADGMMYMTDFSGGRVLRVNPNGSSETFALVPAPQTGTAPPGSFVVAGNKALTPTVGNAYGQGFLTGTFSVVNTPQPNLIHADKIYFVSADGGIVDEIAGGFDGLELYTFGPGGAFGNQLYIAELGSNVVDDGKVSILSPDGGVTPFISGIDAAHVVFDTQNVMGGGMFVAEFGNFDPVNGARRSGRIWHVTLKGDFNGDSELSVADIDLLCNAIRNGGSTNPYDVNQDNAVNLADLTHEVVNIIGTHMGDADVDDDVDLSDLGTLATNYQRLPPRTWGQGDFDCDQDVDLSDLGTLATNYGLGQSQAYAAFEALTGVSVPEPSCLTIIAIGGVAIQRRRC